MANSQSVKIDVERWREHSCIACECKLRYRLRRRAHGTGHTREQAVARANHDADGHLKNTIRTYPCPNCGTIQPEMAAVHQIRLAASAAIIGLVGLVISLIAALTRSITIPVSVATTSGCLLFVLSSYWMASRMNFNRKLERNKGRAQHYINQGVLCSDQDPDTIVDLGPPPKRTTLTIHRVALRVLLACLAVALLPEGLRVLCQWPDNRDWFPNVAGPGDQVTKYLDDKLVSLNRMWIGENMNAVIRNSKALRLDDEQLAGRTKNSSWGRDIKGRFLRNRTTNLWVTYHLPPNNTLAGKTLEIDVTALVRFPVEVQPASVQRGYDGAFAERTKSFRELAQIRLADDPRAGAVYMRSWLIGESLIILCVAVIGVMSVGVARVDRERPTTLHDAAFDSPTARQSPVPTDRTKRLT